MKVQTETDMLTVDVETLPIIFTPKHDRIIVRQENGNVVLCVGARRVTLTTTAAHAVGMSIFRAQVAPDEMIVISINGVRLELLLPIARKVAAALLRKADAADDWQIQYRRKLA